MKTLLKFSFLGALVFFSNSCEDVVQIKLDEGSKLYVIDAFVNDLRSPQIIRVTSNDSYFANRQAPPVANATVILKDLTANTSYPFAYGSEGNYIYNISSTDTIARVNHQYQLNVTIDGVTYSSLTIQKRPAVIDSIHPEYQDGDSGFGPRGKPFYFCTLWAKDKVDDNADYYWVKTFRNDTLFSGAGDISVCIDGTGAAVSGLSVDSVDFTPPATLLSFKTYQSGNTCKAEVHSISKETYFFLTQAVAQIDNGGLFATTPENVKTNIITPSGATTKCIGWFNMASVASKTKVIP